MSIDARHTLEVPIESIPDLAKYLTGHQGSQGVVNPIVQVSDVTAPILQVQDAVPGGTIIQMPEGSVGPLVQMADQAQPIYITEGFPNGIQILDGSLPFIQSSDGTSIIQLATPTMVSGASMEGLTQIVQFAGGQVALVEQQENIDPQNVQHFVLEQIPAQQASSIEGEIQQQQQLLMDTAAPEHVVRLDHQEHEQQQQSQHEEEITQPPIGKGPFTCDICEKKLEKWNQYQRHMRSHEDDKPFRCFNCPASFNIADNLKLHLATHVEPGDKPVCPECGKKFSRVASLKAHIMMHEKEENLMCPECGDEFSLQGQLDKHMLDHQEDRDGTRLYACRQCNASFTTQKDLKDHTKQHFKIKMSMSHRTYKKEIDRSGFSQKCPHCSKSFQKPSQLERHVRIHTGDKPFKCVICPKSFNQKGALQMHILGRHTNKKPHKCQFCKAGFSQKGNLRAHVQRVHTVTDNSTELEVHKCEECPCVFKKLGSLNAHISRFHTERPEIEEGQVTNVKVSETISQGKDTAGDVIQQLLELSEAGSGQSQTQQNVQGPDDILQQALQNSGLPGSANNSPQKTGGTMSVMNVRDTATGAIKKHYVRKLGSTTWHQCAFCMKEFKKPSDLVRHTRIHSHEKPYKCTQCFRAFAVKSTLNSHIRTHTGIKQYKCSVCNKSFSTHGSLKVHLRLHTGAKPFDCSYCDKKFRTTSHRKNHLTGHFKSATEKGPVRLKSDPALKKIGDLQDIPLQEPILITDTGLIQQPPRNSVFNQYLGGESGSVDRPYKCTFCQRGFKKSSHLKQHIRSHTGEKPYKCLQCSRTFVSNGVLKAHIRIHTGLKQYKCVMCENLFSTNGSLKRHMSTHSDLRPFMCPYCQRTFKTSVNCKKHMKTHRAELAVQSLTSQTPLQNNEQAQAAELVQDTEQYVEEEPVDSDLTLVQQELNQTSTIGQTELGQQSILTQAGLQDALGLSNSTIDSNILNQQQMFNQQQTFTQSLLGSGQQNFQQMNNHMASINQQQNQYNIQQQQQQINQVDLNSFNQQQQQQDNVIQIVTSVGQGQTGTVQTGDQPDQTNESQFGATTVMPSTSMENILETRDNQTSDVEDEDDVPTQQPEDENRSKYTCEFCQKPFKKSSHLKQHIRSHTGEKPFKCTQCDKTFVSMGVLRQHVRSHTGLKEFKCSVCNALFSTNGSLTRHMNIHVCIKPYKCPFCLEGFRTASMCKKHMKEHTGGDGDDEDEAEKQQQQNEVTVPAITAKKKKAQFVEILQPAGKPQNQDMNLSEKLLVESASERDRISELRELNIPMEKHNHECPHCPKSFKKPSDLVRHIRIHTGEKPFACPVCRRTFTVKSTLDSHMKTHGGFEKTIRCHICSSMFSTKGSLKVHMRLHTGAKPFKCPHCTQRFRTSGHRKSHILSHYKDVASMRKKRNTQNINIQEVPNEPMDYINQVDPNQSLQQVIAQGQNQGQIQMGQVINIDQSMLNTNVVPFSLTVDGYGNINDNSMLQLQGMEGVQLQLPGGNIAQGIQITGLDQSNIGQTVHIDANLLQQIQSGNFNITLNANQAQTNDPNIVPNLANIQLQPMSIQEGVNPNMVVQTLGAIGMDQATMQQGSQSAQMGISQELPPGTFVMAANGGIIQEQMGQPQVVMDTQSVQSVTQSTENVIQIDAGTQPEIGEANAVKELEISVLQTDIDQESQEMRAIDPNMTTDLSDTMMSASNQTGLDNDDVDNIDNNDDDLDNADEMIEETTGDDVNEDHMHNPKLDIQFISGQQDFVGTSTQQTIDGTRQQGTSTQQTVDETRQHQCHICQKTFKRNSHLKEHIQTHMKGADNTKAKDGFHSCQFCEKRFQKPSQLDRHVRIHTGERPFICSICSKAFNQKNALQIHVKKHTGERPHKCLYCNTAFTQKGNLKTHIKRAHHEDMVSSMNLRKSEMKVQNEETATSAPSETQTICESVEISKDQVISEDINLGQVAALFNSGVLKSLS